MKNKLNNKGQAAITDALFFLTIIIALCVLMFQFSATYGDRINLATSELYFKEYSNSALKTIFYSEIPLNFSKDINADTLETDYLMTAIKADYYDNGKIGSGDINFLDNSNVLNIAKYNLFNSIKAIMYSMPNYDYLFYLQNESNSEFEIFIMKITNFEEESITGIEKISHRKKYKIGDPIYLLCSPEHLSDIKSLMSGVNNIYSSAIPLRFSVKEGDNVNIIANFSIWPGTATLTTEILEDKLKCKVYEEE